MISLTTISVMRSVSCCLVLLLFLRSSTRPSRAADKEIEGLLREAADAHDTIAILSLIHI